MSAKNFSLIIAGLMWILVGLRIATRALSWMDNYFQNPDWHLALLLISVAIGVGKSNTVLKKAVCRKLENIHELANTPINYCFGWAKMFGVKGVVLILGMIGLGFGLRYLRDLGCDPFNLLPFLYLGVALALALASRFYFQNIKT